MIFIGGFKIFLINYGGLKEEVNKFLIKIFNVYL